MASVLFAAFAAGQSSPSSVDQRPPREVKPPLKPADQHLRLGLTLGINILPWVAYTYRTTVNLADGRTLQYTGTSGAPGLTASGGVAVTLPGALRRITVGGDIQAGGLYTVHRSVIPEGTSTPFSIANLQQAIQFEHSFGQGWRLFAAPYIEHDIATMGQNKLRLGYQYSSQGGAYDGSFPTAAAGRAPALYDVQMRYQSHMVRFSWTNYLYTDDLYDRNSAPPERRNGLLRQMGICVGTHGAVLIFFAIGPVWDL